MLDTEIQQFCLIHKNSGILHILLGKEWLSSAALWHFVCLHRYVGYIPLHCSVNFTSLHWFLRCSLNFISFHWVLPVRYSVACISSNMEHTLTCHTQTHMYSTLCTDIQTYIHTYVHAHWPKTHCVNCLAGEQFNSEGLEWGVRVYQGILDHCEGSLQFSRDAKQLIFPKQYTYPHPCTCTCTHPNMHMNTWTTHADIAQPCRFSLSASSAIFQHTLKTFCQVTFEYWNATEQQGA